MKKIAILALALVIAGAAGASAQDTKVFRDLLVVDDNGRKVGSVADGLGDDRQLSVLAETKNKRPFLLQMFRDGFVGDDTVKYTGAGCTGQAWVTASFDPSLSFIEKAQLGVDPETGNLAAFLLQRGAAPANVDLASYW